MLIIVSTGRERILSRWCVVRSPSWLWEDAQTKPNPHPEPVRFHCFGQMRNTRRWLHFVKISGINLSWSVSASHRRYLYCAGLVWNRQNNAVSQRRAISRLDPAQHVACLCFCFCVWLGWGGRKKPLPPNQASEAPAFQRFLHGAAALVIRVNRGGFNFRHDFTSPSYPECNAASQTSAPTLAQKRGMLV